MLTVVPTKMEKVVNAVKKRMGVSSVLNASRSKLDKPFASTYAGV